jgi:hypothetical protein|tara:strand:+ start:2361 stop:4808 length:2448 start_codon:yes stop_codon:yes gene_type:complete
MASRLQIPGALADYASRPATDGYLGLEQSVKAGLSNTVKVIDKAKDSVEEAKASASELVEEVAPVSKEDALPQTDNITPNSVVGATENVLKRFASFNYNITLACLSTNELNFPESTYRNGGTPEVTVIRSGGQGANTTKALIADETSTAKLEYFIDEVEMQSIIAPTSQTRTSNATSFSFKVNEPYSMGLFLQSMMVAALKAGHRDYLKAPYALIIDFKGFDDDGNPMNAGALARRVFPIKLANVEFEVNSGGSQYGVSAFAWNESALSNVTQYTKSDISITGDSVLELLQKGPSSLTNEINKRIRTVAEGQTAAATKDEYFIMFPEELKSSLGIGNLQGAPESQTASMTNEEFYRKQKGVDNFNNLDPTGRQAIEEQFNKFKELYITNNNISSNIRRFAESTKLSNNIGKSVIAQSMAEGGAVPFGQEAYVKDENGNFKTDEVTISKNFRTLTFPKSTSIEQIIEEVVILSAYAKESATQLKADGDGMIDWFRVHTQTFLIPDESVRKTTGENPKVYVYAVVPYKVHSSVFSGTSQPSVGLEKRKKQAAKRYDYIYTGKNDDIIDFDINFNNAFYNALQPNINGSGDAKNVARDSANASTPETYVPADGNTEGSGFSDPSTLEDVNNSGTGGGGGGGVESPAVKVSRMFNDAIVNSAVDMITMDLTVLGDPYYLADSGLGNYSSPAAARGYTSDGSMDYQRSEVEVDVNFRTPIDYNDDGGMTFPQRGTEPVGQFSGLYKVLTVQNTFSGGKFTQVLSLLRRKKQDDANIAGVAGDENKAVVSGPEGNVDKNVITPASATETTSTAFVGPPGPV